MNKKTLQKRRLQSELKAISKYTLNGNISASQLGFSHKEMLDELIQLKQWIAGGEGIFLEDKFLMLCRCKAGDIKLTKVLREVAPLINTMLYKSRKVMKHQIDKRTKLLRTIPLLTMTLLYGFLRASGRIREDTKASIKISRSPMFIYEKMDKELKTSLGTVSVLFQGRVNTDLQKVLFIGANASPIKQEGASKGFPPVVIWMLKRYMENKENDYFI